VAVFCAPTCTRKSVKADGELTSVRPREASTLPGRRIRKNTVPVSAVPIADTARRALAFAPVSCRTLFAVSPGSATTRAPLEAFQPSFPSMVPVATELKDWVWVKAGDGSTVRSVAGATKIESR
jgi:hypothetical protein